MFKLNVWLSLICVLGTPVILLVIKLSGNTNRRVSEKVQNLTADASEIAEETVTTIRTVRSFANENGELKRYTDTLQQAYGALVAQAGLSGVQKWFVDVSFILLYDFRSNIHLLIVRKCCNECNYIILWS